MAQVLRQEITAVDHSESVWTKLIANIDQFNKSSNASHKELSKFRELSENSGAAKLGEHIKGLGEGMFDLGRKTLEALGIIGSLSLGGLVAGFIEGSRNAGAMGLQMLNLGISARMGVEDIAALKVAARESGISIEALAGSYDTFGRNVALAQRYMNPDMMRALGQIGLSPAKAADDIAGSANKAMTAIFAKYGSGARNKGARDSIEQALFGTSGPEFEAAMHKRIFEMDRLKAQAGKEGPTSNADMSKLVLVNSAYEQLAGTIKGIQDSLSVQVSDGLTKFLNSLSALIQHAEGGDTGLNEMLIGFSHNIEEFDNWLNKVDETSGKTGWQTIGEGLKQIASGVREVGSALNTAAESVGGWKTALEGIALFMGTAWIAAMMWPIVAVTSALTALIGLPGLAVAAVTAASVVSAKANAVNNKAVSEATGGKIIGMDSQTGAPLYDNPDDDPMIQFGHKIIDLFKSNKKDAQPTSAKPDEKQGASSDLSKSLGQSGVFGPRMPSIWPNVIPSDPNAPNKKPIVGEVSVNIDMTGIIPGTTTNVTSSGNVKPTTSVTYGGNNPTGTY